MSFVIAAITVGVVSAGASIYNAQNAAKQNQAAMDQQAKLNQSALDQQNNQIQANKQGQITQEEDQQNLGKTFSNAGRAGTVLTSPLGQPVQNSSSSPQGGTTGGTKTVLGG